MVCRRIIRRSQIDLPLRLFLFFGDKFLAIFLRRSQTLDAPPSHHSGSGAPHAADAAPIAIAFPRGAFQFQQIVESAGASSGSAVTTIAGAASAASSQQVAWSSGPIVVVPPDASALSQSGAKAAASSTAWFKIKVYFDAEFT